MFGYTKEKGKMIPSSLCERCANAVPSATTGCEWSEFGQPIDGWVTFQFDDPGENEMRNRVMLCPKFDDTKCECPEGSFNKFREFSTAIVAQAVIDYRFALEEWERNKGKYIEAYDKRKEMDSLEEYKSALASRYRKRGTMDIHYFVRSIWENIRREYDEWLPVYRKAVRLNGVITSCERFFRSPVMDLYTDVSGDFIISQLNKQVKEDKSWKLNRKITRGYTYREINT